MWASYLEGKKEEDAPRLFPHVVGCVCVARDPRALGVDAGRSNEGSHTRRRTLRQCFETPQGLSSVVNFSGEKMKSTILQARCSIQISKPWIKRQAWSQIQPTRSLSKKIVLPIQRKHQPTGTRR